MDDDSLPKAVAEHQITVNGIEIRCAVLSNGMRVTNADDVNRWFRLIAGGEIVDEVGLSRLKNWAQGGMEH